MYSVVIPVFNHADFVSAAVISCLTSLEVGEVLLCDDGSSDQSSRVVDELEKTSNRVRVIRRIGSSNRGAPSTLNELIREATFEWIAVLNSDDEFTPGRFECVSLIIKATKCELVYGDLVIIDKDGRTIGRKRAYNDPQYPFGSLPHYDPIDDSSALLSQNYIATTSNMVFSKALWESVGGFREYRYVHDWDFALRCSFTSTTAYANFPLSKYRIHGRNTISESTNAQDIEVKALFKQLFDDFPVPLQTDARANLSTNRYLRPSGHMSL